MARFGVADISGALRGLQIGTQGQVAAANTRRQREAQKAARLKGLLALVGGGIGAAGIAGGAGGLGGFARGATLGQAAGGAATGTLNLGEIIGGLQAAQSFGPTEVSFEPDGEGGFNRIVTKGGSIQSSEPVPLSAVPKGAGARSLVRSFLDQGKGLDEAVDLVGATERFKGLGDVARAEGQSFLVEQDIRDVLLSKDRKAFDAATGEGKIPDFRKFANRQQRQELLQHGARLGVEAAQLSKLNARAGGAGRNQNVLQRELRGDPNEIGLKNAQPVIELEGFQVGDPGFDQAVDEASAKVLDAQLKVFNAIPQPTDFTTNTMRTRAADRLRKDSEDTLTQALLENPNLSKDDARILHNNIEGSLNAISDGIVQQKTSDAIFDNVFASANALAAEGRVPGRPRTATEEAEPFSFAETLRRSGGPIGGAFGGIAEIFGFKNRDNTALAAEERRKRLGL